MQINDYLLNYDQAYEIGRNQVGTKAFNVALSEKAGFQVPEGIVLPVQIFTAYRNGSNLEALFSSIEEFFTDVNSLIVRSSSLEEDTADASCAGQYLSLVCSNKAKEVKKACEACLSSYSSPQVKAYQKAVGKSGSPEEYGMGLLIQRKINAFSSGVCFTRDPLNDQSHYFIINAVHGMGESLMLGEVVADHYEFNTNNKNIINHITGKQTHWRNPESPQTLNPLPLELLKKPVLTATQINEISHMAQKATKSFQDRLDIEWAYEGDELFLLQVRPITATVKKRGFTLWTRDNVADVIPDAVTPLTWSLVKDATNNGFKNVTQKLGIPAVSSTLFFKVFDGRVYFNQSAYQGLLTTLHAKSQILKVFVNYLRVLASLKKDVSRLEDFSPGVLNDLADHDSSSALVELKIHLNNHMAIHIRVTVLMEIGFLVIRKLANNHIPQKEANPLLDGLVTGLNQIASTASGKELWELSCLIQDNEELTKKIVSSPNQSIPNILSTWGGSYSTKWQQFLNLYGHSSLKEFEIYYPRWIDDPGFIISTLKHYLSQGNDINPAENMTICSEKRMECERILLKKIPRIYHLPLKYYINHVRQCSIWRESIKQKLVRIMSEIRKQSLALAKEYAIEPLDNVFFLTLEEIIQLKSSSNFPELFEQIAIRKKNWKEWDRKEPFKEIRVCADGRQIKIPYLVGIGDRLHGMPLSSGKAIGPARIIADPTNMKRFHSGDILVAPSTNPSWTPIFILAGAIVTDMGNYLSHGAIVARELGIPAVGNLLDATKRITDGQMLHVDGDSGTVTLIKEE